MFKLYLHFSSDFLSSLGISLPYYQEITFQKQLNGSYIKEKVLKYKNFKSWAVYNRIFLNNSAKRSVPETIYNPNYRG